MSVDAYLTARSEFTAIKAELASIVQVIGHVGSALTGSPDKFIFANQSIGLPMEATMSRGAKSVDAQAWPSVERIMRVLERYHSGRSALQSAWTAVPQQHRDGLKSPDDLLRAY